MFDKIEKYVGIVMDNLWTCTNYFLYLEQAKSFNSLDYSANKIYTIRWYRIKNSLNNVTIWLRF